MPSPFPGMAPYLEGYLWPDVHSALVSKIRQFLTPLLRPKYAARLDVYLAEDLSNNNTLTITPPALSLPVTQAVTVRLISAEIRDTANNKLVTSIQMLSPVNKREPNLTSYRQK